MFRRFKRTVSVQFKWPPFLEERQLSKQINTPPYSCLSVAALELVILIIYGTLGPNCGCKDFNTGKLKTTAGDV